MDSTVFKYNHQQHHHQQQQHHHQQHYNNNNSSSNNIPNNNNQNSIFILNTASNNILANNPKLHFNDNHNAESSSASANNAISSTSSSSSVWSSASSTMCSPAAHAIQKLFNCSSNSSKLNQGNYSGIESKSFKSKSELLKKKSKFWKYLESETNENNNNNTNVHQHIGPGVVTRTSNEGKSRKTKSKYWSKSYDNDNKNNQDLSELLEYSCSLCDNCRCIDCQIAYFDCENSDDSNSEYSFHMNAYEEDDEDNDNDVAQQGMELKISKENQNLKSSSNGCYQMDNKHAIDELEPNENRKLKVNCECDQCCQQCLAKQRVVGVINEYDFLTTNRDH